MALSRTDISRNLQQVRHALLQSSSFLHQNKNKGLSARLAALDEAVRKDIPMPSSAADVSEVSSLGMS